MGTGKIIFVTAFKGGVGKTTVTAGMACALSALGKRVCILDGDFGMRCMDLVLGMEDNALYDCYDVLSGAARPEDAILPVGGLVGLWFLPAPIAYRGQPLSRENAEGLFKYLRSRFDYCLIDSSAELSPYYRMFADASDEAIVVSLHQSTAIRAAEKTAANLAQFGFREIRLVVNCYHDEEAEKGRLPNLEEMIYRSSVPLLGVVLYSPEMVMDQEANRLPFTGRDRDRLRTYEAAFLNIACRILGAGVPLGQNVGWPGKKMKEMRRANSLLFS
ncbi:MAG: AAA family ATPase [Clostridia bacterium]|nr:AAA family ATPase [Clostridia bacterium]